MSRCPLTRRVTVANLERLSSSSSQGLSVIIEKRRQDDTTVLCVEGIIKLGESAEFLAQTLERVLQNETGHVVIDLSQINYIDSTGIGELVGYLGRFRNRNRQLILAHPSERIRKLLAVAQLDSLFPIYDTLEEALATTPS